MAERIKIVDENELKGFFKLRGKEFEECIFYLDACTLQKNIDYVEKLMAIGNFRIADVAFKELLDWKKPGFFHPAGRKEWERVHRVLIEIKEKWPQNIEKTSPTTIFRELSLLEPMLSKTITFDLLMRNFDKIYSMLANEEIDVHKFAELLKKEWGDKIFKIFIEECEKRKNTFKIDDLASFKKLVVNNITVTIVRIIGFAKRLADEGYGLEKIKELVRERFENKIKNDKFIVEHYLLSDIFRKHFPTDDKDTEELALLHRNMILLKPV